MIALKVLQFLPLILSAVTAVEQQLGAGSGATKKAVVMAAIRAAIAAGETMDEPTIKAISMAVNLVVNSLNLGGVFKRTPVPAASIALPPGIETLTVP